MKINFSILFLLSFLPPTAFGAPLDCADGVTATNLALRCDGNNYTIVLKSCSTEEIDTRPCSEHSDIETFQYCHQCGEGFSPVCSDNNDTTAVCADVLSDTCGSINYEVSFLSCPSSTDIYEPYWVCNDGVVEMYNETEEHQATCVEFTENAEASMCLDCGADGFYCASQGQTCESLSGNAESSLTSSSGLVGAGRWLYALMVVGAFVGISSL